MKGWKTTTGAVFTIIGTMYGMYNSSIGVAEGFQAIGAALAAIGIGHKLDRMS